MGIALFTLNSLIAPLRSLTRWLAIGNRHGANHLQRPPAAVNSARVNTSVGRADFQWAPATHETSGAARKPLRVVRIVETCHGPSIAGRMIISGRMADVCAELDRLATLEAAHC